MGAVGQREIIIQINNSRKIFFKMDADAKAHEELSKPQTELGCKHVSELNIPSGAKVLDMGCGTGLITKYIADIVGSFGVVIGIDPDAERIKIAQKKYKVIFSFMLATVSLDFHMTMSHITTFMSAQPPFIGFHQIRKNCTYTSRINR